jgi:Family of unknown function (DUF5937)
VHTTIGDLLGQVRSTPADQARREVAAALGRQPRVDPRVERILTSSRATGYIADVLAAAWRALLEPEWRTLRAILERDVIYRAGQLASRGWAAALTDLHADVSWRQGRIELSRWSAGDDDADLGGRGLLFIPSVFVWPRLALSLDPPWPPALIYPARGVSAQWERPARTGPGTALHQLLGGSRAAILLALEDPASTTQLAATLGQSLGGIGTTWPSCARPGWWPGPGPDGRCSTAAPRSGTRWPPPSSEASQCSVPQGRAMSSTGTPAAVSSPATRRNVRAAGTERSCALGKSVLGSAATSTVISESTNQASTTRRQWRARHCARRCRNGARGARRRQAMAPALRAPYGGRVRTVAKAGFSGTVAPTAGLISRCLRSGRASVSAWRIMTPPATPPLDQHCGPVLTGGRSGIP